MCAIFAVCVPAIPEVKNRRLGLACRSNIRVCASAIIAGFLDGPMVPCWSTLEDLNMQALHYLPIAPGKKVAACLCLFAVILLWTPVWAAALQSHDCCAGGMCPTHSHRNQSNNPVSSPSPMDCEHHGDSQPPAGLASCSLSCCQDSEHPTIGANLFVVPEAAEIAMSAIASAVPAAHAFAKLARTPEPLSPPPRA